MMSSEGNNSVVTSEISNTEKIEDPVDSSTHYTTELSEEIATKSCKSEESTAMVEPIGETQLEYPSYASVVLNAHDAGDENRIRPSEDPNSANVLASEENSSPTPQEAQVDAGSEISPSASVSALSADAVVAESETDSKEESKDPVAAEQRQQPPADASVATEVAGSPSNALDVVINAPSNLTQYDFITTPHGNDIVERSPGERYVRFMEKLGSGASKDVYRAYDTQEGIEVAWNVVHLAGVPRNERNRIVNEVQLLERLHHHNIISFHGSWVNREKQQVNFVTEILSSGTLKSFITKVQVIRWKIAKRWALQILKGLEYLHSQDPPVIHRDLKCENIFINGTSGDLRIGDLGLSTVHRNGKQLSVLGTPEFMAPDMYEENPYDEKVDIYSFGMCMLEIFTKEIPYGECSNPAQIYKRVSRGDPPGSLKRIHSDNAREFIEMCLGHLDENGKYLRPSATELLAHPFLQKRPNDDDEVQVSPPMQERTIGELSSSSAPSMAPAVPKERPSPASSSSQPAPAAESLTGASSSSKQKQHSGSNSLEDDGSDRFDEMPDSEVNMRKVKVMMGRGQELKEEEVESPNSNHYRDASGGTMDATTSVGSYAKPGENNSQSGAMDPNGVNAPPSQPSLHYLVAAAVVESNSNTVPHQDEILKLVVTLPVDGQTQNVQFDFHLVEDDPIQVAKEMLSELGIPQGAVLEISETISGLACTARVNQDKYIARQQTQGDLRSPSQLPSVSSLPAISSPELQHGMAQQMEPSSQDQNQGMVSSNSYQSMPEFRNEQQQMVQTQFQPAAHAQQAFHQQGMPVQEQQVPMGQPQPVGQPASLHPSQMQPHHVHVQNADILDQNFEIASQSSYGQQPVQPMQMKAQLLPHHVNPAGTSLQSENHGQHQQLPAHPGLAPAPAQATTHATQPQYEHSMSSQVQNQGMISSTSYPSMSESRHETQQMVQTQFQHAAHAQQPLHQQGMPVQEQQVPMGQAQQIGQPGSLHPSQMQPHHVHVQNTEIPDQNSEIASQPSYGQQPMQMKAQLPPQHVNHGHSMPVPAPMNMQQTSSSAGQYELSSVSYGHSQPQQVQMPSQQTAAPEAQSQGPASFAVGQMQIPATAVGQGVQVQEGRHQDGGGHVMQQQEPAPVQSHQLNVPQQPTYVAPQPGQNQAYANSAAPPTPTQSMLPMHQQPPPMQQAQQIPQPQQLVYAVDHSSQVESTGGPPHPSQAQAPSQMSLHFQEAMQATSNPQQAAAYEEDVETSQNEQVNGVLEVPAMDRVGLSSSSDEMDEERAEELRMLDEEFNKTVIRAKKVFGSRMDNITRLQHEREAQHQKTLSEHEKRRADFEKRLQQEEIEQNRRIVQLQQEWERKRQEVRRIQEIEALAENSLGFSPPADDNMIPVSNESGSGNEGDLSE